MLQSSFVALDLCFGEFLDECASVLFFALPLCFSWAAPFHFHRTMKIDIDGRWIDSTNMASCRSTLIIDEAGVAWLEQSLDWIRSSHWVLILGAGGDDAHLEAHREGLRSMCFFKQFLLSCTLCMCAVLHV